MDVWTWGGLTCDGRVSQVKLWAVWDANPIRVRSVCMGCEAPKDPSALSLKRHLLSPWSGTPCCESAMSPLSGWAAERLCGWGAVSVSILAPPAVFPGQLAPIGLWGQWRRRSGSPRSPCCGSHPVGCVRQLLSCLALPGSGRLRPPTCVFPAFDSWTCPQLRLLGY